ncbi:MAG: ABC transporter substrate-binding protein [Aeromicrobium sp.]
MSKTSPLPRRRGVAAIAIAVAATLGLSACSSGSSAGSDDLGKPQAGGTLKIAFWPDNAAFSCVDPFQTYWIEHRTVIRNLADSLTDQDPETGEITPWLADSWEISPDGKTYTFRLRDGVTFSDGSPVDAAAIKGNVDGWLETVKATSGAAFGSSYVLGLESAEVVDPLTVTLSFSAPNSSFLQATSTTNLAIVQPDAFSRTPEQRCLGEYVASGAFTLDSYKPNELLTISKRPGYAWGSSLSKNTEEAYLDTVEFSYVAEDSVRTGNLVSGAVDIAWPRNPFTVEDRELIEASDATVEARSLPGVSSSYFPNVAEGKVLSDPTVRQAVIKALDLESYASTIYGDDYPVVGGAFDETTPYYVSQADKLAFDQAGAEKLLDAAGWTVGEGGYRFKDGKKLTLQNLVQVSTPGDELIQDQLKQVGIDFVIDVVPAAERPAAIANGDYDLVGTYFTRADPGALQFILDPDLANSKALAVNSSTPETLAEIKDLFATAAQTTDDAVSKQAYDELQSLLVDEGVTIPVFERVQYAGVSNTVGGFAFTSESFLKLNDVWKKQ